MVRNYLLVAFRNLSRQKGYAAINILGLAVGMACCLLIVLFVRHELSYDQFHTNADRIYRVLREDSVATSIRTNANLLGNFALNLKETFPTVEQVVRLHHKQAVLGKGDDSLTEDRFFWSDAAVFDVFDFTLESGDPSTALTRPNTVVVTRDVARKHFGDTNPIGQTLSLDSKYDLEVTGIVAPPPSNSHIQFNVLASMSTLGEVPNQWAPENQGWTYVLLSPGQSAAELQSQVAASLRDLVWWWNLDAIYVSYKFQLLTDVHLYSTGYTGVADVGDRRYVVLFLTIAALILLIACINYMNLATARAARRAHEVGMRKSLGASRRQIVAQFMSEAIVMSVAALAIALVLVKLVLPVFNVLVGKSLVLYDPDSWGLVGLFAGVALVTGLLAGSYPAVFLSRFDPVRVLKGLRDRNGRSGLRQGLVVVQFGISVVLLIGTAIIYKQMHFIQNKNLGFDTEQVVVINKRGYDGELSTLLHSFEEVAGVASISAASGVPIGGGMVSDAEVDGTKYTMLRLLADSRYARTMGLAIEVGRDFDPNQETDRTRSILVNESMAGVRGWENPLQESMQVGVDDDGNPNFVQVIGVVSDFHTGSLHEAIMPAVIDPHPRWEPYYTRVLVRLEAGSVTTTIPELEARWKSLVPGYPFDFSFLDEDVDAMYRAEQQFGKLFGIFTAIAIFVACLGLFGLAAYTAEQRTREIGIRKVLGASVESIVLLLSRDFLRPVLVGYLVAVPLAYIAAQRWLDDFAFRIDLSPAIFVLAGLASVVIALTTVSIQALRSAFSDPVESLRYE